MELLSPNSSDYEQFTYDAAGNLNSHRMRDGTTLTAVYDALNRRTTDWNGATIAYDNVGHVTSASLSGHTTCQAGDVCMTYDALGRKISETSSLGAFNFGYDALGGRISITWPDGISACIQSPFRLPLPEFGDRIPIPLLAASLNSAS